MNLCDIVQDSIEWCEGAPQFAGIQGRVYYTAASNIAQFPERETTEAGRDLGSYKDKSSFKLFADKKFHFIDILPAKSSTTSESQGEYPSISQLNKLELVIPGTGEKAADACAYLNNVASIFVFKDMEGNWRVAGCERWKNEIKVTVATDLGQGSAGTAQSTISVEAPDSTIFPVYKGEIDEGDLGEE